MFSRRTAPLLLTILVIVPTAAAQDGHLWVGPNVNMVSGTTFPDGDPFLQRQNEPSAGVSTRNPLHILAGANDYRAVDIPGLPEGKETGDSWLGVFKSLDGGSTWRSYLMPGYPQDTTDAGMNSPLKNYDAAADPVVRAGTDGLFYYAGIVFIRENLAESAIIVSRFEDLNNDERGDPIAFIDTQIVATGSGNLFVDKPWMAVDKPRGGQCGYVYVAWAEIDSSGLSPTSRIMFSRSTDCGATWAPAFSLSDSGTLPQGSTIAVSPSSGDVHVAWRQHTTLSLNITDCFHETGIWKNAPEMWPVEFITMGGITYTKAQAIDILQSPTMGDATRILAYQLIPAKLNFEVNNVSAEIQAVIDAGDQWLFDVGGLGSRPSGTAKDEGIAIKDELEAFNTNDGLDGLLGPGVCGTEVTTPSDAIVVVKSDDYGASFGLSEVVAMVDPFDQGTSEYSFRSNSYPTMTADKNELVYLAWTTRGHGLGTADPNDDTGDARIVVSVLDFEGAWSTPQPIDRPEIPGHQIKPSLTYTGGKLLLTYYDFRKDISGVFDRFVADWPSAIPTPRHTVDVRAAIALPGLVPEFTDYTSILDPVPSTQTSRYAHYIGGEGLADAESVQMKHNGPNLPMFKGGTVPFFSDYLDIAESPTFVPDGYGGWEYNFHTDVDVVAHVVWTDNRDVVGPPYGDWTTYVPPTHANSGGTSIFDSNQTVPECDPQSFDVDRTRMRNQNIYTARVTEGLYVAVPGNSRPLGYVPGTSGGELLQRAFVVFVQNATAEERSFELEILGQPVPGEASFDQFSLQETADVTIEAYSSASRTVFVKSSVQNPPWPSVEIDVTEVDYLGDAPLHSTVLINPDPYNPAPADSSLADGEIYNPSIWNPSIWNPSIWNPSIWNPSIWNPSIWNPSIWNPSIWNPSIWNPSLVNPSIWNPSIWNPSIWNPSIWNPSIWNTGIANPSIWNPSIWNPSIWNAPESDVMDVTWMVRNDGNATSAYSFNLLADQVPSDHAFQLMVYRVYTTPVADGCELKVEGQQETLVNINDPGFTSPDLLDPNTMDPDVPSFSLGPGEEVFITLRVHDPDQTDDIEFRPEEVQVAVVAQGVDTEVLLDGGDQQSYAKPDISVPLSDEMDDGRSQHTATPLSDGTILITGGFNAGDGVLDTAEIYDPEQRTFEPTNGYMGVPRYFHTATPLEDGTVLIVGGATGAPGTGAEIFDPVSGTFTPTPDPNVHRSGHRATLMADGRVLISGGNEGVLPVSSAEVFDPGTGTFTPVAGMGSARWEHSATLLSTGEVLIAGGYDGVSDLATAELFDPSTDTFSNVSGAMTDARRFHSATLLPDGTVLLAGGLFDSTFVANQSADIYDRATDSLTPTGTLIRARAAHTATLLADGKVLLTGGQNMIDGALSLSSHIELYDWSTDSFIEKGHMTMARTEHTAVRMPDGKVFLAGGATYGAPITVGTDIAELYVPANLARLRFTDDLDEARSYHAATLLADGRVLVTGGRRQDLDGVRSAELFDPGEGEFSSAGDMLTKRLFHSATRLLDGRVLIAGGRTAYDWSTGIAAAEIYDPSLGTFAATGSLIAARSGHRATLLTDGRVLITGGQDPTTGDSLNSAEIYDPVSGNFTFTTGPMIARRFTHTATRLTDGRVLLVGGINTNAGSTVYLDSAEIFDPATESFTSTGSMNVPRTLHAAVRLTDGRVLITGGSDDLLNESAHGTAEVYDPATGVFSYTNEPPNLARLNFRTTRLPDGRVLITGGMTTGLIIVSSVETFDPVTGTFAATDAMNSARSRHTATALDDGRVLLTAGWETVGDDINLYVNGVSAEIYNPPPADEALVQRNALISLYNATNGNGWTNNTNWLNADGTAFNEPGTECTWWGVTCDVSGTRVVLINLSSNNLAGWLPPELGDLSSLRTLELRLNQLTGVIPPELGNLSNLTGLYLVFNQLTGSIPRELGNLSELLTLAIGDNQLRGPIPPEIWTLTNLEEIHLNHGQLSGAIPPEVGNLTNLEVITIISNEFSGPIPFEFSTLSNLRELHLGRNQFDGTIPAELGTLPNLEVLRLHVNNLTGEIPVEIGNISTLRTLHLYKNQLTGSIPSTLGGLANLEELLLDQNMLEGLIPPELGNLGLLEQLNLQGNMLSGPIPVELQGLASLDSDGIWLHWNALYTDDDDLSGFLGAHTITHPSIPKWRDTQTIAPLNIEVSTLSDSSIWLSWTPISYQADGGGYQLFFSATPGGPYDSNTISISKATESGGAVGLDPGTTYYMVVQTRTLQHAANQNDVYSKYSVEVSATTTGGGPMIPAEQRLALIALYNSTDGDNWTNNTGWLGPPGTECTWYGVTCDVSGNNVTRISLIGNNLNGSLPISIGDFPALELLYLLGNDNLTGPIPASIGNLAALQSLNAYGGSLTGPLPPEIGNLSNLEYLGLSENQLDGAIPPQIGNLTSLTELVLEQNLLSGEIPPEIGDLANLRDLHLGYNQLSGELPPELGNLSNLRGLYLGGNQLSGEIPPELGNLSNLQFLYLSGNQLMGIIPTELGNLANLSSLYLGGNELSGEIPPELENLSNLQLLYLSVNELTGTIPGELGNLGNLRTLGLQENQLSGEIPPELGSLSNLRQLNLSQNQLAGLIPAEIWGLSNLSYLNLSTNQLTGSIPPEIGNLSNLRGLFVYLNQLNGSIPVEMGNLLSLQSVWLNNNQLTGGIPSELGNLTNLREIEFGENQLLGNIPASLGNLSGLMMLALYGNQLSGAIPSQLGNLSELEELYLGGNQLTGTLPPQIGNLGNLKWFAFEGNRLSGSIPPEIGNLTYLETLWLSGNQFDSFVPVEIQNLTNLISGQLDIRWNALYSVDPSLTAFLNSKQSMGDWQSTQTVAPSGVTASDPTSHSVILSWTPIIYDADPGGYEISYATDPGGPYNLYGQTADKTVESMVVDSLDPSTQYYFEVHTVTDPHSFNLNTVVSESAPEVSATTGLPMISTAQRDALIALYNSTGGGSWNNSTNWLGAPGTECTWYGVTCDATGENVAIIVLNGNNLNGSLPISIGDFPSLEMLELVLNPNLMGPIPASIGNLAALQTLDAYGGSLSGSIPPEIGNLSNLEYLELSQNQLDGAIPAAIGNLSSLEYLRLWSNQLNGTIPSELGNLANLRTLTISGNQLSGVIPTALGNLANLTSLRLSSNQLSGEIPSALDSLSNLIVLYLDNNQLSGEIPPELENLSNLRSLYLNGNELTGTIPSVLGNLSNLWDLRLSHNQLSGGIPADLGNLSNLRSLYLSSNQLNGSVPSELGNLANLWALSLSFNQLSGGIPPELGNLLNLNGLYLNSNQLTGSIPSELGNLANLSTLYLFDNQLTGQIPAELGNLSNLQNLHLFDNQLTGSIPPELGGLSILRGLYLYDNQLSGTIPWQIGDLGNLYQLSVGGNQLEGPIPTNLVNLVNLQVFGLEIRWNALYSGDPTLTAFLTSRQGSDWQSTQTIAPTGLSAGGATSSTVNLNWTPIAYTDDGGGYEALYAMSPGGPYTVFGTPTADKTVTSITVTGLAPSTLYHFVVRAFTDSHSQNQNAVTSENSVEVPMATTP